MSQSTLNDITCAGVATGSISAVVTGGPIPLSGPIYEYQWYSGTTTTPATTTQDL